MTPLLQGPCADRPPRPLLCQRRRQLGLRRQTPGPSAQTTDCPRSSGGWESKAQEPADSVSGEVTLHAQTVRFSIPKQTKTQQAIIKISNRKITLNKSDAYEEIV